MLHLAWDPQMQCVGVYECNVWAYISEKLPQYNLLTHAADTWGGTLKCNVWVYIYNLLTHAEIWRRTLNYKPILRKSYV